MIGKTILRAFRTILVILLMELARVTNLKPNLEARSTTNEDYQGFDPEVTNLKPKINVQRRLPGL